ncbi:hypothetical protein E4U53_001808 [Claviceps sorghi]|nr:hypothetical protein E4U53_001808 [Claviceps sorghi]
MNVDGDGAGDGGSERRRLHLCFRTMEDASSHSGNKVPRFAPYDNGKAQKGHSAMDENGGKRCRKKDAEG